MFRSGDRFVFTWVAELVFGEFDILQIYLNINLTNAI